MSRMSQRNTNVPGALSAAVARTIASKPPPRRPSRVFKLVPAINSQSRKARVKTYTAPVTTKRPSGLSIKNSLRQSSSAAAA